MTPTFRTDCTTLLGGPTHHSFLRFADGLPTTLVTAFEPFERFGITGQPIAIRTLHWWTFVVGPHLHMVRHGRVGPHVRGVERSVLPERYYRTGCWRAFAFPVGRGLRVYIPALPHHTTFKFLLRCIAATTRWTTVPPAWVLPPLIPRLVYTTHLTFRTRCLFAPRVRAYGTAFPALDAFTTTVATLGLFYYRTYVPTFGWLRCILPGILLPRTTTPAHLHTFTISCC